MSKWVFWAKLWMNLCFYSGGKSPGTSTFLDDRCWLIIRSLLETSLKVQGRRQVIQCFFHEVWKRCFQNLSALADTKRWNSIYCSQNVVRTWYCSWSFTGVMIYCNRAVTVEYLIWQNHISQAHGFNFQHFFSISRFSGCRFPARIHFPLFLRRFTRRGVIPSSSTGRFPFCPYFLGRRPVGGGCGPWIWGCGGNQKSSSRLECRKNIKDSVWFTLSWFAKFYRWFMSPPFSSTKP